MLGQVWWEMSNYKTRGLRPGDIAYITSTWMNSFRSNNKFASSILHRIYSSEHNSIINKILNSARVLIACDPEDEDHIFGYVVYSSIQSIDLDIFHYVYIKAPFQKKGIARALIETAKESSKAVYTQKNEKASWIADKLLHNYENVNYNPYLFFKEI